LVINSFKMQIMLKNKTTSNSPYHYRGINTTLEQIARE
jgi:hypothetical protein